MLIARGFPPITGGIENLMYNVYSRLYQDDFFVIAPFEKSCKAFDEKQKLRIYRTSRALSFLNIKKLPIIPLIITSLKTVPFLKVKQIHCDQVQSGIIGYLFNKLFGKPYVVWAHGREITGGGLKWLKSIVLRNADMVITVSNFTRNALIDEMGVENSKIVIIHPGVDIEKFNSKKECENVIMKYNLAGKKVLLTVGRLSGEAKHKGRDMVINALPKVSSLIPDVVYLIVGSGDDIERLQGLVQDLELEEKVVFTGYVPDEELPQYYNACDLFIMPSRERTEKDGKDKKVEGFGIVFLEANACGKPVIGGRSGGIEDAVIDGVTGILVNPNDLEEIVNAVIKLLKNDDLAARLGKQGRERIEKELTWDKVAKKVQVVISSI